MEYVVPRTSDPWSGAAATLAKQKYAVPSGIMLYWRVITLGVRNATWTAHFGHEPEPCGNLMPLAAYFLEMLPATSTRRKWSGMPGRRGSDRLHSRCAQAS